MTPSDLATRESLTPRRPSRRSYSKAFKAQLIAESRQPGASIAGVALAHGVNANLLNKWIRAERAHSSEITPSFVPVALSRSLLRIPVIVTSDSGDRDHPVPGG